MGIEEMHNAFRVTGQQMGMQTVRTITPESIDVILNDVIIERVRQESLNGVLVNTEQVGTPKISVMSPLNALGTLYRIARFDININEINDTSIVKTYNATDGFYSIRIPLISSNVNIDEDKKIHPMMYYGFSINYKTGNSVACRLINQDEVEFTLTDYNNAPSKEYPIVTLSNDNEGFYLDIYTNTKNCELKSINIKFIKYPKVVKYDYLNDGNGNINCDLPDYLHSELVNKAVQKYFNSLYLTSEQNKKQQ